MTAESIRTQAFAMQKGGYSTSHVDAALERLEDAFASRERERAFARRGRRRPGTRKRPDTAQVILDRLARARHGAGFRRVGALTIGTRRERSMRSPIGSSATSSTASR